MKNYFCIENRPIYLEKPLCNIFPRTSGTSLCVEKSDLAGSKYQSARSLYGSEEKYVFATLYSLVGNNMGGKVGYDKI